MNLFQCSLQKLVDNLNTEKNHSFKILDQSEIYSIENSDTKKLLLRKGVYPYDYYYSLSQMKNDTKFPPHKEFFSRLANTNISNDEYERGVEIFKRLQCANMAQFGAYYCLTDTILLLEVLCYFANIFHKYFGLYVYHCISLPQFSYVCFLKFAKIELDRHSNVEEFEMIERGIRGGHTLISQRLSKSGYNYHTKKYTKLNYIDCNGLYSFVMQKFKLPWRNFKMLSREEIQNFNIKMDPYGNYGFILDVDLYYPPIFSQSDFPLVPDKKIVAECDISEYSKETFEVLYKATGLMRSIPKIERMHATFGLKKNYVVTLALLQFYIKKGVILKKINRVLSFEQKAFMSDYVNFCTNQRKLAKNEFEKTMWKLQINSLFGKTIEKIRDRTRCYVANTVEKAKKYIGAPNYKSHMILNKDCVLIFLHHERVELKTNISIGMSILDFSKLVMYTFYYDKIRPKFPSARLCLSDTDSLFFETSHNYENAKGVLEILKENFDYSNYPSNHPLFDNTKQNIPGYFKDEAMSKKITEMVGLRTKTYSYQTFGCSEESIRKCKGVNYKFQNQLKHKHYLKCLLQPKVFDAKVYGFISKNHNIELREIRKRGLTSFDLNRFIFPCGIHTSPYGCNLIKIRQREKYSKFNGCPYCKIYGNSLYAYSANYISK